MQRDGVAKDGGRKRVRGKQMVLFIIGELGFWDYSEPFCYFSCI